MNQFLPLLGDASVERTLPDSLLQGLHGVAGLDVSEYRRSNLARRLDARMQQVGMEDSGAYAAYCEDVPGEYARLAQTILIPVTRFFRDRAVWEAVQTEFLPRLLGRSREPIRVWCAGCASGEEAYTLAMILAEAVGRDLLAARVRLLATDVSAPAVERARRGVYSDAKMADVPPRLRDTYWTRTAEGWTVCPALREAVRFECHDLAGTPPMRRLDLISCRNTLMYFDSALQGRVLIGLARALRPEGCLLLGQAEGIPPGLTDLAPLNRTQRLFTRRPREGRRLPPEA